MANMRLAMAARNALADVFAGLVDAADNRHGTIKLYTGPQPASADAPADGQTLLATLTFEHPAAGAAIGGVTNFNAIAEDSDAPATGEARWARIADGNGRTVFDCDVTRPGEGGTIEINTTDIVAGGPVRLRNFIITFPAG
jgi:hypothetical protein